MAIEARSVGIYKARQQEKKKERNIYPCAPAQNISWDRKMQKRAGWLARKNQMLAIFVPKVAVSWCSAASTFLANNLRSGQLFCPLSFIWHAFLSSFRLVVSSTMHFHVIVIDSRFYFYGHLEVRWECKVIIDQWWQKALGKYISCFGWWHWVIL